MMKTSKTEKNKRRTTNNTTKSKREIKTVNFDFSFFHIKTSSLNFKSLNHQILFYLQALIISFNLSLTCIKYIISNSKKMSGVFSRKLFGAAFLPLLNNQYLK